MKLDIQYLDNNVCAPRGFKSSAIACGIKKVHKLDVGLIYSSVPAVSAAVFTQNKVKAAPLLLTKKHIKNGRLQAVIINSGNANACTGDVGESHAKEMASSVARSLNISDKLVGVASTGVIGVILPIEKITSNIPKLVSCLAVDTNLACARAILTTDLTVKEVAIELKLSNSSIKIGGIAKGSGMIHPNMATMLGFITTDAYIEQEVLQEALTKVTNKSFNMMTVDGDSSTNDMVLVMANGEAGNKKITSLNSADGRLFYAALEHVSIILAKKIVEDGEGATKLIEVNVTGAKTNKQARAVAKAVASSSLVKTAIFGNDANWGRIACAVGYGDKRVLGNKIKISLNGLKLFAKGVPLPFSEEKALELLKQKNINIDIDLGLGDIKSTAWGCDLSYDYVKINAAYRT